MNNDNELTLRPTEDYAFKRLFGWEDGKRSLTSLLNAILDGNPVIESVKILNTETQIESRNNKASKLDIEVLANDKTYINVELQCVDKGDLYSRAVFYSSSMMIQHSMSCKGYTEPNVISIWIIRDKIKNGIIANRTSPIEEIVHCMLPTKWGENYEVFSNKSRIIWVQLAKIKNNEKIKNSISKELRDWAEFFSDPNAIESSDEGMKDAQKLWNRISANDQLTAQLRAEEKYQRDKDSEIAINREEGRQEGIAEGLEKGKEEGLAEGLEKGEHNAKTETARKMLTDDLSMDVIAKYTGLTIEEVKLL